MLLRRISEHVKDQNWFAVALDFLIVVFGVFMGFQVQAWNENRKDEADAILYVERLVTDIDISIADNETNIRVGKQQIAQSDLVISALETCNLPVKDRAVFASGLYHLGKYNLPSWVMSTIDELNATGKFHLVGDADLRRQITDGVRAYQTTIEIDSQISGRSLPSINYVRSKIRFNFDAHYGFGDPVNPEKTIYNFDELCADTTFINAVATVRELTLATTELNRRVLQDQQEILQALNAELGQPPSEDDDKQSAAAR